MDFTLESLVNGVVTKIVGYGITLIAAASVLVFLFGIAKYIFKGDSDTARTKGRKFMLWGIVGLFVMFAVWGILTLLSGIYGGQAIIPQFNKTYDLSGVKNPSIDPTKVDGLSGSKSDIKRITPSGTPTRFSPRHTPN